MDTTRSSQRNQTPCLCLSFPRGLGGWRGGVGGLTCGWRFGCCCAPSPGTSPGGGRSGRRRCCGCSWGRRTPCSSIGCTPAQRCPPPAGPRFLRVRKGRKGEGGREISPALRPTPEVCPVVSPHPFPLTKVLHAVGVGVIQEEVAAFDGTVHLKAQPQAGILHQLCVDLMRDGLQNKMGGRGQ